MNHQCMNIHRNVLNRALLGIYIHNIYRYLGIFMYGMPAPHPGLPPCGPLCGWPGPLHGGPPGPLCRRPQAPLQLPQAPYRCPLLITYCLLACYVLDIACYPCLTTSYSFIAHGLLPYYLLPIASAAEARNPADSEIRPISGRVRNPAETKKSEARRVGKEGVR